MLELEFGEPQWFDGECDFEAYDTRSYRTGKYTTVCGVKLYHDSSVDLTFTIAHVKKQKEFWRAAAYSSGGGAFHLLAMCDCRSEESARLWCNRLNRIDIQGGAFDKELLEIYG